VASGLPAATVVNYAATNNIVPAVAAPQLVSAVAGGTNGDAVIGLTWDAAVIGNGRVIANVNSDPVICTYTAGSGGTELSFYIGLANSGDTITVDVEPMGGEPLRSLFDETPVQTQYAYPATNNLIPP
jgi:hypothetical protein